MQVFDSSVQLSDNPPGVGNCEQNGVDDVFLVIPNVFQDNGNVVTAKRETLLDQVSVWFFMQGQTKQKLWCCFRKAKNATQKITVVVTRQEFHHDIGRSLAYPWLFGCFLPAKYKVTTCLRGAKLRRFTTTMTALREHPSNSSVHDSSVLLSTHVPCALSGSSWLRLYAFKNTMSVSFSERKDCIKAAREIRHIVRSLSGGTYIHR